MAQNLRSGLDLVSRPLPQCFQKLGEGYSRIIAEEIYDVLSSLQRLIPPEGRNPSCPATALGERKSRFVVAGVMEGRRFRALESFETPKVKFVGVAAGVLAAVRLGAVNPLIKELFSLRIRDLTTLLGEPRISAVRPRVINRDWVGRVQGISPSGLGKTQVAKFHAVELVFNQSGDNTTVWTFRVIDVGFHPQLYSSYNRD